MAAFNVMSIMAFLEEISICFISLSNQIADPDIPFDKAMILSELAQALFEELSI